MPKRVEMWMEVEMRGEGARGKKMGEPRSKPRTLKLMLDEDDGWMRWT